MRCHQKIRYSKKREQKACIPVSAEVKNANFSQKQKKKRKKYSITNAAKYRNFKAALCIIFSALENLVPHSVVQWENMTSAYRINV